MTYGPSTNRLMTAEEYARLDRIRAHAMLSSVERTCPAWTDTTTPRTDAPVRFAVVRWPSRDGARMDRLTCIRPQWSRPVNRPPVRFPA